MNNIHGDGGNTEHQAVAEGLREVGEVDNKGRSGPQSGRNFLQGGATGGNPLWIGDLGTFGGYGEYGGGDTCQVSEADHGEAGAAELRQGVGDSQGGISVGIGRNLVGNDLH